MAVADDVVLAVEREVVLVAAEPRLRIGCPTDIDTITGSMVSTVNHCDRSSLLAEIHLAIGPLNVEVAVYEHCASARCAPERFLPVEVEVAMTVYGITVKGIVGTFKMTVLVIGFLCTVQRIKVETTDKTHVLCPQTIAVYIAYMGLRYSIAALLAGKGWIQRVVKVNIAEVAHCDVFYQ